jgi:hypothetical protein
MRAVPRARRLTCLDTADSIAVSLRDPAIGLEDENAAGEWCGRARQALVSVAVEFLSPTYWIACPPSGAAEQWVTELGRRGSRLAVSRSNEVRLSQHSPLSPTRERRNPSRGPRSADRRSLPSGALLSSRPLTEIRSRGEVGRVRGGAVRTARGTRFGWWDRHPHESGRPPVDFHATSLVRLHNWLHPMGLVVTLWIAPRFLLNAVAPSQPVVTEDSCA